MDELEAIVERAASGPLDEPDRETLRAALQTLFAVTNELELKGASIRPVACLTVVASRSAQNGRPEAIQR